MKRLVRVFLAGTAITLGFGQIVSAADLPVKAPVAPVAAPDWTGFYIGLNTGGSIGTGSASQNAAFNSAAIGANALLNGSDRSSPSGWVIGGQLGYNKQISNWVVGLEADWQWTSQKANSLNCTPPAATCIFWCGSEWLWLLPGCRAKADELRDSARTRQASSPMKMVVVVSDRWSRVGHREGYPHIYRLRQLNDFPRRLAAGSIPAKPRRVSRPPKWAGL